MGNSIERAVCTWSASGESKEKSGEVEESQARREKEICSVMVIRKHSEMSSSKIECICLAFVFSYVSVRIACYLCPNMRKRNLAAYNSHGHLRSSIACFRSSSTFFKQFRKYLYIFLFIWLHWVLVVAHGTLDLHCGMRDLYLRHVGCSSLTKD